MIRPFPSCSKSLFQSEAAYEAIVMKMSFIVVQRELIFTLVFKLQLPSNSYKDQMADRYIT